ncbi:CDP-glucose 4,6-dehydratase [Alphaproteobacteria bacterium]|nr:CDP-glucose 4,6-dehydratase [Alphaproteobacteria bacterium]
MFGDVYKNKKVVVFGHSGFKGSWLSVWLKKLGAEVYGFSLLPEDPFSGFYVMGVHKDTISVFDDIRDLDSVKKFIDDIRPDFVFHLAAQALVGRSYADPISTWNTNLIGTINILETLRGLDHECVAVIITSDKVYKNKEWVWGYRENDELGGSDPYSASKSAAEIAVASYLKSFLADLPNLRLATTRAGNVIGGADWSDGRVVPDCMQAWFKNEEVVLRQPYSTRPWQHVLEPLSGYLTLGQMLFHNSNFDGNSFNFGPRDTFDVTVADLVGLMEHEWLQAKWSVSKHASFAEAGLLKLNCDKAASLLNWRSTLEIRQTVQFTVNWYKCFLENQETIEEFSKKQIDDFTLIAKENGSQWVI